MNYRSVINTSSVNFKRSLTRGQGKLSTPAIYLLERMGLHPGVLLTCPEASHA